MDVLGADHAHEIDIVVVVVERELGQPANGLLGRQRLQVQALLGLADVAVELDQAFDVQLLLAAEVVVDHALGGGRSLGNGIHPRAGQALLDELVDGDLEDVLAGFLGVVLARLACPFDLGLAEGGFGMAHSCSRGVYWDLGGLSVSGGAGGSALLVEWSAARRIGPHRPMQGPAARFYTVPSHSLRVSSQISSCIGPQTKCPSRTPTLRIPSRSDTLREASLSTALGTCMSGRARV